MYEILGEIPKLVLVLGWFKGAKMFWRSMKIGFWWPVGHFLDLWFYFLLLRTRLGLFRGLFATLGLCWMRSCGWIHFYGRLCRFSQRCPHIAVGAGQRGIDARPSTSVRERMNPTRKTMKWMIPTAMAEERPFDKSKENSAAKVFELRCASETDH